MSTTKLRLGPLPKTENLKLTFNCPANLKADLERYAILHSQAHGEDVDALRIRTDAREYLASLGLTADKRIITHCQSHHRSGFTYLVGKAVGLNIRAYHGSWAEWGNHPTTPVEQ